MNLKLEVCAVGVFLTSGALFAQDEWTRLMERGQTFERDANYTQAAASYRDAVRIAQGHQLMVALNSLGLACEEMGRFPDAERYLRRALVPIKLSDGRLTTFKGQVLIRPASRMRPPPT